MEPVKLTYVGSSYCSICGTELEGDSYILTCGEVKRLLCDGCCSGVGELLIAIGHEVSIEPRREELRAPPTGGWRV